MKNILDIKPDIILGFNDASFDWNFIFQKIYQITNLKILGKTINFN